MTKKVYAECQHDKTEKDGKPTSQEKAKSYLDAVEGKGVQRDKAGKSHRLAALRKQLLLLDKERDENRPIEEEEITTLEFEIEDIRPSCQNITPLVKWLPRELEAVKRIENETAEKNAKLST